MNQDSNIGKKKALIISVSDYGNNIHPLPFCKNDGERMYQLLKSLGYEIPESNKLIGQVKSETMRDTISDFFTQRGINSKDTLLFYFSGHGLVHNDVFYLATSEIDPYQPYKRGIDQGLLKKVIDDCPSKKIVMILDSCHSGMLNPFSKGDDKSAASVASDTVNKMNMAEGRFLLASCKGSQESFGAEDGSKFTQYVIEGLQGNKGSIDKDGYVTPDSLSKYIYDEMMDHPEKDGTIQRPIIKVEGSGEIMLANYPDLVKPIVVISYREKRNMLFGLAKQGIITDDIIQKALKIINPESTLSEKEKQYNDLIDLLLRKEIEVGKFFERWYGLKKEEQSQSVSKQESQKQVLTGEISESSTRTYPTIPIAQPHITLQGIRYDISGDTDIGRKHEICDANCQRMGFSRPPKIAIEESETSSFVSKHHLKIFRDRQGYYWIQDLGSKNGTAISKKGSFQLLTSGKKELLTDNSLIALCYHPSKGSYMTFTFHDQ